MNKSILHLFFLLLIISCKKENNNTAELHIKIQGLKNGEIILLRQKEASFSKIKTITIDGQNEVHTSIKLNGPEMLFLALNRKGSLSKDSLVGFFAEPTQMTLTSDLELFSNNLKVSGSKNQEAYYDYQSNIKKFGNQELDLIKQLIEQPEKTNEIQNRIDATKIKKQLYSINFAFNQRDLAIAPFLALHHFENSNPEIIDSLYSVMGTEARNSIYGKQLFRTIKSKKGQTN